MVNMIQEVALGGSENKVPGESPRRRQVVYWQRIEGVELSATDDGRVQVLSDHIQEFCVQGTCGGPHLNELAEAVLVASRAAGNALQRRRDEQARKIAGEVDGAPADSGYGAQTGLRQAYRDAPERSHAPRR